MHAQVVTKPSLATSGQLTIAITNKTKVVLCKVRTYTIIRTIGTVFYSAEVKALMISLQHPSKHGSHAETMLYQRLRRWYNIDPAFDACILLSGTVSSVSVVFANPLESTDPTAQVHSPVSILALQPADEHEKPGSHIHRVQLLHAHRRSGHFPLLSDGSAGQWSVPGRGGHVHLTYLVQQRHTGL